MLLLRTPWRHRGEWRYNSPHSYPRHCTEVIGRLHALVTTSRRRITQHLLNRWLRWSESWWGRVGEESISCLYRRSNHCFSACEAVTPSVFFFYGVIVATGPGPPPYRGSTITLTHTTLSKTSVQPDAETSTWQQKRSQQTSMYPAGFEPAIPASERPQTHALERAASGTGK